MNLKNKIILAAIIDYTAWFALGFIAGSLLN